MFCLIGFFWFEGLWSFTYPLTPRPRFQQHFHVLLARLRVCTCVCTQLEIGRYCTVRHILSLSFTPDPSSLMTSSFYRHLKTDQH